MEEILSLLMEISEDAGTPKNVKDRLDSISMMLKDDSERSIKLNKALNELDEIANDTNIEQFTRTQLFGVLSLLERANNQ